MSYFHFKNKYFLWHGVIFLGSSGGAETFKSSPHSQIAWCHAFALYVAWKMWSFQRNPLKWIKVMGKHHNLLILAKTRHLSVKTLVSTNWFPCVKHKDGLPRQQPVKPSSHECAANSEGRTLKQMWKINGVSKQENVNSIRGEGVDVIVDQNQSVYKGECSGLSPTVKQMALNWII